jgi:CRP-like cAMP-binding protein
MEEWRQFLAKWPLKTYDKGQMILYQDASPTSCYLVRDGFIKAYLITADGNEKPISFEGRGDMFPIDWIFGHTNQARYFYDAYTTTQVYQIPREALLSLLSEEPKHFNRLFHYMIRRTIDYHHHISCLEQAKAVDKLLLALHLLVSRFGRRTEDGHSHMLLPLTQQDLASFLGLTRETTGAQLKQLEKLGVLSYKRQRYIINHRKLDALIAER